MASLRSAINAKCIDCCCGQKAEVRRCAIESCSLWPVRPFRARVPSDGPKREQPEHLRKRAAMAEERGE